MIKANWFVRFAWLIEVIYNSKSHVLRCKVCVHAKAKNVFVTGKDCAKPNKDDLGKTRDICRPPEIDVAAEAPDGLRDCERSREVGDYRPYVDRVDASEALVSRQL